MGENMAKHKPDQKQILEALKTVRDPQGQVDIVSAGMVSGVQVDDAGQVLFMIEVDPGRGPSMEPLRQEAENAVAELRGVQKVTAVLTAEKIPGAQSPSNDAVKRGGADPHGMGKNPPLQLPIRKIIAVASGKGGVGKSTVAAAIARKLAENSQLRIGLLDADIYGPSQPKLMGLEGHKPEFTDEKKIIPPEAYGVKVMSIGFMVEAEKALVWRGPMVQSALYQLFRDVQWASDGKGGNEESGEVEPLDVLIVDMPPGTGDAQLTLAQKIDVNGAVIVSTPQELALADARKAVEMFSAVDVPILGLVENMSSDVFGRGGARNEAEKLGVPFLGEIPLSADIRVKADAGEPFEIDETIVAGLTNLIS